MVSCGIGTGNRPTDCRIHPTMTVSFRGCPIAVLLRWLLTPRLVSKLCYRRRLLGHARSANLGTAAYTTRLQQIDGINPHARLDLRFATSGASFQILLDRNALGALSTQHRVIVPCLHVAQAEVSIELVAGGWPNLQNKGCLIESLRTLRIQCFLLYSPAPPEAYFSAARRFV